MTDCLLWSTIAFSSLKLETVNKPKSMCYIWLWKSGLILLYKLSFATLALCKLKTSCSLKSGTLKPSILVKRFIVFAVSVDKRKSTCHAQYNVFSSDSLGFCFTEAGWWYAAHAPKPTHSSSRNAGSVPSAATRRRLESGARGGANLTEP